jgi:hypothetical protein
MVRWFQSGEKQRKTFLTADAANQWVRDQKKLVALGASPAEVAAATRLSAGTGFDLETLVRAGLDHMRGSGANRADASMTFAEAAELILKRSIRKGGRPRTIRNYKAQSAVINKTFGARVAVALTAREVDEYLAKLPNRSSEVGSASAATKRTHLTFIKMALRAAGVADPLRTCELPVVNADVRYFRIDEIKRILAATPVKARGFVAVALFGCVRPENLELLTEQSISAKARTIRISQEISKDRFTHVIGDVVPPVLWDWLHAYPYQQIKWQPLQRRLKRALGHWIQDGLRHTGATFYCSANGVNATARLLTHESESLVRKNYAGVVLDESVAKEFLGLKPSKIKFVQKDEIQWPDDQTLGAMLKEQTGLMIALRLGCSGSALSKRRRIRNI